MRKLGFMLLSLSLALATVAVLPAAAKSPGANGQIAFTRYAATGEPHIVIANADGSNAHALSLPFPADNPTWSPDGTKLSVNVFRPDAPVRPATMNPDGSSFSVLAVSELAGDTDMGCRAWSPDGTKLLCQASNFFGHNDQDGVYTIRASDGGDLTRLTRNPYPPTGDFGGGDIPGDYSPNGNQFVFMRAKPGAGPVPDRNQSGALFIENSDGTGLNQITPYGLANSHDNGVARWSPDGTEILFAGVAHGGSLYVVHTDGTGLRPIPLHVSGGYTAFTPDWSPDGQRIVFSLFARAAGQEDIYTSRSDGTNVTRITDTPDFEDSATWGAQPIP